MKDGDKVVVTGYVGVYVVAGRYQVYVSKVELSGVGNLYQRFEMLKKKLSDEGLFEPRHKKPLPHYPMNIGVVTAPTGAAVHDIIRVARLRNPYVQIVLFPAVVQGDMAALSIARGIARLDDMGLDVIIVGRGGGSIEDLWAFNEEIVARAIYGAQTPIVSAVGHETDVTIADFVADRRAATPSQAAELTTFVFADFRDQLVRYGDKLERAMDFKLYSLSQKMTAYKSRLVAMRPDNRLQVKAERLAALTQHLNMLMLNRIERCQSRLRVMAGKLEGFSPAKKLARGFGYITDVQNRKVESVNQLSVGDDFKVRLADGVIESKVIQIVKQQ